MRLRRVLRRAAFLLLSLLVVVPLAATTMVRRNILELTGLSEAIVVGTVVDLSDGFEGNAPYTQIRLQVDETLKGESTGELTFRQWGLLAPRDLGNGVVNLNVSPPGWPRFRVGERTILFLYEASPLNGLRTTAGLLQGKFTVESGKVRNEVDNQGLFSRIALPLVGTPADQDLLQSRSGPLDEQSFLSFVRRALANGWAIDPERR